MQTVFNPYDAETQAIARRQQYADLLRQQSMQPLQGQMAGRVYVPPHALQGVAQLAQALTGRRAAERADADLSGLAGRRSQAYADALKGYGQSGNAADLMANPDTAGFGADIMIADRRTAAEQAQAQAEYAREAERDRMEREWKAAQAELDRASREKAAGLRGASQGQPYYQFLPGADGYLVGNARTGQIVPGMVGGERAVPGALDPALQGQLAGSKAAGKMAGEAGAEAQINLPQTIATADQTLGIVQDIIDHPGLPGAVGAKNAASLFGVLDEPIAGTPSADFVARLKQLEGKQFLQAFESLKGGGQITEMEGKRATDAIAAMQRSQSEEQFRKSAREFMDVVRAAKDRAMARAGGAKSVPAGAGPAVPQSGTVNWGDL